MSDKKKKSGSILPIIIGILVMAAIVFGVMFLSSMSIKESTELAKPTSVPEPEDDGKLDDYEKTGLVKLPDYKTFKYTEQDVETEESGESNDSEDRASDVWDQYLEKCEISEYPDDLLNDAIIGLKLQYAGFAEATESTYEEVLAEYGMDESTIREVAGDTVKARLVAKTIVFREQYELNDTDYATMLMRVMGYEEKDKEPLDKLVEDYIDNYGPRPKDDAYIEYAKDILLKNNPKK